MSENKVEDQVFSKVILCGEHSVLRGGMAIVAPLKSHSLDYSIEKSDQFEMKYSEATAPFEILIEGTLEKALSALNKTREDLLVKVNLKTLVPLGKGLGGSAALSVFVSRIMHFLNFIDEADIFSFSVNLENMFHGESSGVDIAGCLSLGPKSYIRGEGVSSLEVKGSDFVFGLIETEEVGDTEECIEKVLRLKRENKGLFYELDAGMDKASKNMKEALVSNNKELLVEAFGLSKGVFEFWDLVTNNMSKVMNKTLESGALAVKPTGSGMGGYVLSVWDKGKEERAKEACSETFIL